MHVHEEISPIQSGNTGLPYHLPLVGDVSDA